jgi:Fur family peroxide stress response transcriptional regulator
MDTVRLVERLREKGLKATPQRLAVYESICASREHPTADQIHAKVTARHPTMSLATVYQTLHLLAAIGLLQELGFSNGISKYDPDTSPHINIVCTKCGHIQDHKTRRIQELLTEITQQTGVQPLGQRIDVYTICDQCTRTETPDRRHRVSETAKKKRKWSER